MITPKKSLVFVAHGSRNATSNQQIASLTNTIANKVSQQYTMVGHAFLEFAVPSIAETIQHHIDADMDEINIFPYFLSNGNHVMVDIPALVQQFTSSHPHIQFRLLPVFGSYAGMANLIASLL